MPFKNVFKFLSVKGWSNGAPNSGQSLSEQKWHRAELVPATESGFYTVGSKPNRLSQRSHSASSKSNPYGPAARNKTANDENQFDNPMEVAKRRTSLGHQSYGEHAGRNTIGPFVAPLAKPEALADLEKPSFESRQQAMQATVQAKDMHGNIYEFTPKQFKNIKYADEDTDGPDDDDIGVMSEAETSSTLGANSYVRRRQSPYPNSSQQNLQYRSSPKIAVHQNVKRGFSGNVSSFAPEAKGQADAINGFAASQTATNDSERKGGIVFLQYQGETKRAVLPVDQTENQTKTVLQSFDDLRGLFAKAFPDELPLEYLRSPSVKIYIQDTSKADLFYELDDLNDIKDRAVLKLHEPLARPNSPPPPPTQPVPTVPDQNLALDAQTQALFEGPTGQGHISYGRRQQSVEDMNYFSEPEFDAGGSYRLQKSASGGYYGGVNAAYRQHRRLYGTLDGYNSRGGRTQFMDGEKNFGSGVRSSMRGSYSPSRRNDTNAQNPFEQDEGYSRIGYRDFASSPTGEAAVDAIYHQRQRKSSRSGSATPIIDEEARIRMMNMEKQLASLSTLVHSALMTKGVSETMYKDLEMLRKEIIGSGGPPSSSGGTRDDSLSDNGSVSRFSDLSSDKGSYQSNNTDKDANSSTRSTQFSPLTIADNSSITPCATTVGSIVQPSSVQLTPDARHTLRNAKRRVNEAQVELKNLRRMAQLNAQCSRDILKDAFDRIKVILNTNKHLHIFAAQAQQQNAVDGNSISGDRKWVNQEEDKYRTETRRVERGLSGLEKEVEEVRQRVVNGNRKLRMSEVESFTDSLTNIGRTAANLKNNFPVLEDRLKTIMTSELEKVVQEEKFLKDEPVRLDNALKRCKKLANTMITMKKLALVQDPAAYYGNSKRPPLPTKSGLPGEFEANTSGTTSPHPYSSDPRRGASPIKDVPGSPKLVNGGLTPRPMRKNTPPSHVLDNLLEELQSAAKQQQVRSGIPRFVNNDDHAEKRVGFSNEIKIRGPLESDTIKKSPRIITVNQQNQIDGSSSGVNATLRTTNLNTGNFNQQGLDGYQDGRGVSPMAASFRAAVPFLNSGRLGAPTRPQSNAPVSEPLSFNQQERHNPVFVPPPPPRFSSKIAITSPMNAKAESIDGSPSSAPAIFSFRTEFEKRQKFFSNGGQEKGQTAAAIVQTNAVDEEPRFLKSASSSESINSQQDGSTRRTLIKMEADKQPPPPPPRNKLDMLEHELMAKQAQNRYVKFQLPGD